MRQEQHARRGPQGDQACFARRHATWRMVTAGCGDGTAAVRWRSWHPATGVGRMRVRAPFRLPGSRQTDRHNQVLNPEPRTRGQPSERGVNSKPAGSRRTQTSAKGRQLWSASAVTVPQEASAHAIETTYFLRHRRQITLPITARVHSRAKVGVRPAPSPSSRSARQARRPGLHRRPCPDLRPRPHRYLCPGFVSRRVSDAYFNRNHRNGLQIHRRTRRST